MLHTVTGKPGRLLHMMIYKPGNLPAVGTGADAPDHEELVVPKSPEITGVFLLCTPRGKRTLFVSGRTACTLSVRRSAHKQKQERNKQEPCVNSIGKRPWQSPPLWRSALAPWQAAAAALPAAPPLPARQHPALPPAR